MKWVDEEDYVGPCRRIVVKPQLRERRHLNRAWPKAPTLGVLLQQIICDLQTSRREKRLNAAIDLAQRLDDRPMIRVLQTLALSPSEAKDGTC